MATTSLDDLERALTSGRMRTMFAKNSTVGSQVAGGATSFWRVGTVIGNIPGTTASTCNNTTLGGINYSNASGLTTYIAELAMHSTLPQTVEVHDRLMHVGGLSGTVTTAQTVGIALNTTADNMAERIGRTDYSAAQWWVEVYSSLGSTAVTMTVSYTNNSGTSGRTTTVAVPASVATARMLQIIPSTAGENIRSIESVTLSATTGTAGSFGVTATLQRSEISCYAANVLHVLDWAGTGFPQVYDSSCLFFIVDPASTSAVAINGSITLVQD